MARPLRIEYPDAFYHVSNSAVEGQRVFPSARYYQTFLEVLEETCLRLNVQVHAYTLLRDEYHLLVKTPEANLSRFMRQIDGLYTQHYQRLRKGSGSLFRGRYKAVLIQPEGNLLPLSRFIHLQVRKQDLDKHQWSSYTNYVSRAKPPSWLVRDEVLAQVDGPATRRLQRYAAYVAEGIDADMAHFYGKKNLSSIMGDEKFRKAAAARRDAKGKTATRGAHGKWRPTCKEIVTEVAKHFKVTEESIYKAARGPGSKNVPRWIAMYLCQELSGSTLQVIAKLFKLKRYGTVSTTVGKLKKEFETDPALEATARKLMRSLSKQRPA